MRVDLILKVHDFNFVEVILSLSSSQLSLLYALFNNLPLIWLKLAMIRSIGTEFFFWYETTKKSSSQSIRNYELWLYLCLVMLESKTSSILRIVGLVAMVDLDFVAVVLLVFAAMGNSLDGASTLSLQRRQPIESTMQSISENWKEIVEHFCGIIITYSATPTNKFIVMLLTTLIYSLYTIILDCN